MTFDKGELTKLREFL
jgi:26S proteasome regulatory subunit N5